MVDALKKRFLLGDRVPKNAENAKIRMKDGGFAIAKRGDSL
jgi:hypothetical protein